MSTFWEKRRAAVAAEETAEAAAVARAEALKEEAELDALTDEEILAHYELSDPDTLESPEDVKDFLSHGLPQRLKNRAMRRLWRLNPVLANVDGLVDYGEDYTDAACVIEGMQTAYQVGKGMLAHIEAMAAKEAEDDAVDDSEASEEEIEDDTPLLAEAVPAPAYEFEDTEDEASAPFVRRRMSFQFESQA